MKSFAFPRALLAASAVVLGLGLSPAAHAQVPADKPIRLVVPYAPGGNVDSAARIIAPGLSQALRRTVVVENRAGAGGMIAGEAVAKSTPDGTTLLVSSNGPVLHSPLIYGKPVYDWKKDFVPVGSVSFTPMVLLAGRSVKEPTLKDVIAASRSRKISLATPGAGSTNHLAAELLQMDQAVAFNLVHYKGTAPANVDLLGGHVDLSFDQISVAMPHVKQGTLRALAVTTPKRVPQWPDVPTFEEAGIKGFDVATFVGVFAPAGTPPDTVRQISEALAGVLRDKAVVEKFDVLGADARAMPPGEFRTYLLREDERWLPVIKKADIRIN
ncbi:Bug family tripartite tricarboxylate transporter substrate binding protein [Ramlibacter sp.]|uniref:Bug family tripartite tricarboxylate transporter substrate binding protein n=1 Tax=Ramlibacter sp. TaxID=1917967 RepID=UPI003D132C01